MTRRIARWLALLGVAMLAGCTLLDPYPTAPIAPAPGQPPGKRVAVCYNRLTTTLDEVRHQAQQECPANTVAAPVNTDWQLQFCPLFLPARATFVCTAKK